MPTLANRLSSPVAGGGAGYDLKITLCIEPEISGDPRSKSIGDCTQKRRLRSNSHTYDSPASSAHSEGCEISGDVRSKSTGACTPQKRPRSDSLMHDTPISSTPSNRKSPRRCVTSSPNSPAASKGFGDRNAKLSKSPVKKRLSDSFISKARWDPRDTEQMRAVKEALHVSSAPSIVVCREEEQKKVLDFCKQCVKEEKGGSLYICGCPGTGKSMSMEKVKHVLADWSMEAGTPPPDVLTINCTSLANTSDIFSKVLGQSQSRERKSGSTSSLQHLQALYSKKQPSGSKMKLIIVDELDYLITRDRVALHDLFMLTTLPLSRCILIGIANAIDLADRFLPRLQSLNCKPMVVTFRAYSKDQIFRILEQRLMEFPYIVFQPQALELCARKVAAASGDMRKALSVCRSAIEMLEAELRQTAGDPSFSAIEKGPFDQQTDPSLEFLAKQEVNIVRVDHMAVALSKTYKSPVVETIQSLPQHQQIILCSAATHFRGGKKDTTVGELNKFYTDICKSAQIPPVSVMELSSMCRVLSDQGLLKLGQSREDKLKRVSLKVDEADITFALQGIRFFRNCLK